MKHLRVEGSTAVTVRIEGREYVTARHTHTALVPVERALAYLSQFDDLRDKVARIRQQSRPNEESPLP